MRGRTIVYLELSVVFTFTSLIIARTVSGQKEFHSKQGRAIKKKKRKPFFYFKNPG